MSRWRWRSTTPIVAAAEVTVCNYFQAKEDLVLPPEEQPAHQMTAELTGASPGDLLPWAVAWQLGSLHSMVLPEIGRPTTAGELPAVLVTIGLSS